MPTIQQPLGQSVLKALGFADLPLPNALLQPMLASLAQQLDRTNFFILSISSGMTSCAGGAKPIETPHGGAGEPPPGGHEELPGHGHKGVCCALVELPGSPGPPPRHPSPHLSKNPSTTLSVSGEIPDVLTVKLELSWDYTTEISHIDKVVACPIVCQNSLWRVGVQVTYKGSLKVSGEIKKSAKSKFSLNPAQPSYLGPVLDVREANTSIGWNWSPFELSFGVDKVFPPDSFELECTCELITPRPDPVRALIGHMPFAPRAPSTPTGANAPTSTPQPLGPGASSTPGTPPVYVTHSPCAPPKRLKDWENDPGHNCYAYACNDKSGGYAQPGRHGGRPIDRTKGWGCKELMDACQADGLHISSRNAACPYCCFKIAAVVRLADPTNPKSAADFHFLLLHSDGTWSHKPGGYDAVDRGADNQPILDPEEALRNGLIQDALGGVYNRFCGYLCVCKSDPNYGIR